MAGRAGRPGRVRAARPRRACRRGPDGPAGRNGAGRCGAAPGVPACPGALRGALDRLDGVRGAPGSAQGQPPGRAHGACCGGGSEELLWLGRRGGGSAGGRVVIAGGDAAPRGDQASGVVDRVADDLRGVRGESTDRGIALAGVEPARGATGGLAGAGGAAQPRYLVAPEGGPPRKAPGPKPKRQRPLLGSRAPKPKAR